MIYRSIRALVRAAVRATLVLAVAAASAAPLPRDSVYRLGVPLTDQSGRVFTLADHRGSPMLVSMFYTSCEFVCPMLVEAIRATEDSLEPDERRRLQVLLVSFDPARDTVAVLRKTAAERHVDAARWQLARTDPGNVRKIAALLDIRYRALDDGNFNHSATIVLVDAEGRVAGRTADLSAPDDAFVALLRRTLAAAGDPGPRP